MLASRISKNSALCVDGCDFDGRRWRRSVLVEQSFFDRTLSRIEMNNFIAQRRSGYVKQMQTSATEANGPERYEALDYGKGSA